jgi:hypothetical protein
MPYVVSDKEFEALTRASADTRYEYFVKRVADTERLIGLYDDGWALMGDGKGSAYFPVWPHSRYAKGFAVDEWAGYRVRPIALEEWLVEWTTRFADDGVDIAVFPVVVEGAADRGSPVAPARLRTDLEAELERYY